MELADDDTVQIEVPQKCCLVTDEASEPVDDASVDVKELIVNASGLANDVSCSTDNKTMSSEGFTELVSRSFRVLELVDVTQGRRLNANRRLSMMMVTLLGRPMKFSSTEDC